MIEFAAGIMLGGSIGAVIMGALLTQTRSTRASAGMQAHAPRQAPRQFAVPFAPQMRADALPLMMRSRTSFATVATRVH